MRPINLTPVITISLALAPLVGCGEDETRALGEPAAERSEFRYAGPETPIYDPSGQIGQSCDRACSFDCDEELEELELERRIFEMANAQRVAAGLPPFGYNHCVIHVAQDHSENQANQGNASHFLDGMGPAQRLTAAGISYAASGENIHSSWASWGGQPAFDDAAYPQAAMNFWMNSPDHRANLLNPNFTILGVGVEKSVEGENGLYYSTQVFIRHYGPAAGVGPQPSVGGCDDYCGEQSPDGCWCDDECIDHGDCCDNFDQWC